MNRQPLKVIEPPTRFLIFGQIADIWRHRELLYLLAWRDYKVKYRQTLVGIAWAIFQPLVGMIAFVFIFGKFQGLTNEGLPYALFVYSGLIIWQYFSGSISEASTSLVLSSQMITKIYFPRIIVPLAKILAQTIDLVISLVILAGLMIYFQVLPSSQILWIIPAFLLIFLAASGIGIFFSALNVRFRDIQYALPYFIQLSLFLSPVIYESSKLGGFGNFIALNPATGAIDLFRLGLFGGPFPADTFITAALVTLIVVLTGLYYFIKAEGAFSDVI